MSANSSVPLRDQKDKPTVLVEVTNIEKQLWALIHSKGLLHPDVRDLYDKACSTYEKIFLSDLKQEELQDVEYSLWKLHYKQTDEFRKRIKTNSASSGADSSSKRIGDSLIEEFKLFLTRATEFYEKLILITRRYYGVPKEASLHRGATISSSAEPKKMQKCKLLCHRFFVCLGDLARYKEQFQKTGDDKHDWSAAATHYLAAAKTWPDSGNPHNQLAVLATYVGDEFLALYHCVRSLAVKEPFPDAWNNLILLFETNRSIQLQSLSFDVPFDFSKPSKRSSDGISNSSRSEDEKDFIAGTNLWSLVVRTMSFFFLRYSFDDFPCVFASTMRELDAMLAADDRNLKPMLESYQIMDTARKGPFRTLQLVSIFIFVFHNLTVIPKTKGSSDDKNVKQQALLKHLGLAAAFTIMGRLVERCLSANPMSSCPLLPAILVFVEYLPFVLDEPEEHGFDEKSASAMSYFFGALANLLNGFNVRNGDSSAERTTLWEDDELRGFEPVSPSHTSLDFSNYLDQGDTFERGSEFRVERLANTAVKIANRPKGTRKWIFFDKPGSRFSTAEFDGTTERKEQIPDENGKSVATEEEEVILFKPLTRYNSAPPLYPCIINTTDLGSPKDFEDQMIPSDECLRRATSLLIAQHSMDSFASDISNFGFNEASKQPDSPPKDSLSEGSILAGPPSLSAWVINSDRDKGRCDFKHGLSPIDERISESFTGLSINETEAVHSISIQSASTKESADCLYSGAASYSPPVPSAPLLPDDASWFHGTYKDENFGTSQKFGYRDHGLVNYGLPRPDIMNGYPNLPFCGISSSEWLRRYRANHQNNEPANYSRGHPAEANLRNFRGHDSPRFGLVDRYGIPADLTNYTENSRLYTGFSHLCMAEEHKEEKLLHGYQRANPFDLRDDPRPLLQYLKEKERLIQQDRNLRGPPTFMKN